MVPTTESRSSRRLQKLVAPVVLLLAAGGVVLYLNQPSSSGEETVVLTVDAKAYTKNLQLSGVQMKATDNTLGQTLVEIVGNISNQGDRSVSNVLLTCVFYDPYGQVVTRELVSIVRGRDGVLAPGETRSFRLPFDALPDGWNQAMPQLVIAQLDFE